MVKFRLPKKFIGKCDWFDEDEDQEKEKEPAGWGGGEMVTELKELISEKIPFPHDAHKRESVY